MRKFLTTVLLLLAFSVSLTCLASEKDSPIRIFKLEDGHTIVIKEVHANPIVTIDTWVKTGSAMETPENNGISHFLEHLMFKGTKNHKNGEIEKILESKGARFNAATSKDFTHYYVTTASDYADTALKLHADMLQNPVIPEPEMNKEKKVVQEEIRRANDNPKRILLVNLFNLIFQKHPYKMTTLGSHEIIENVTREEMLSYFNQRYTPSNLITIIVGDIDTKNMLALAKENFSQDNDAESSIIEVEAEPEPEEALTKIQRGEYKSGYLMMGFKGVPISSIKETYALDLAALILGGSDSSRLYQVIREDKNLVTAISAGNYSLKDDSVFMISADFEPEKYQEVKSAIMEELEKFRNNLVTYEELKRAKTITRREFIYDNESVENIANSIGYSMAIGGNIDYYKKHLKYVDRVTPADIQKVAQKYLIPSRLALSVLLPEEQVHANQQIKTLEHSTKTSPSDEINVNNVITDQKTIENTTRSHLSNDMILLTSKNTSNDIVTMNVFLRGGTFLEPKPGVAGLLTKTLMYGTTKRPYKELIKELEDSGITLSPRSSNDYFEITVKSTKDDFDKAFEILADVIKDPTFEEKHIEKNKEMIIKQLEKSRDRPLDIAIEEFLSEMYKNHPYGNIGSVLDENVPKLTRKDVVDYWNQIFIPENVVVSVAGNVDHKKIAQKLLSVFPSSGKTAPVAKYSNEFSPLASNIIIKKDFDSKAAWMLMGWPIGNNSDNKELASFKVLNSYLSGGLSSRLHKVFREDQGLAYSVGSSYSPRRDRGHFVMYIGTEPKNVELVKNKFLEEIELLKTKPLSQKELQDIKSKIIGNYALSQETNQSKSRLLGRLEIIDKKFGFNYDFPELINNVTSEDVMNTAKKYLNYPYVLSVVAPQKESPNSIKK